jgi:hypothetical protein
MNAQDFSRQGKRKRRPFRDAGPYKNLTWRDIRKGKLSDLVNFVEGHYPEKSLEETLTTLVDLVSTLRIQESKISSNLGLIDRYTDRKGFEVISRC